MSALPIDELLAKIKTQQRDDPIRWARRILQREANGEHLPMVSIRFAKEALANERTREADDAVPVDQGKLF